MKSITQLYRYCNYLSLDVACGAMVCASFFSHVLNVQLRPYGLASLGLTVWIIYTADHLLDARKLKQAASSQRHRFHQKRFRELSIVLIMAILIDFSLVLFVRKPILDWGVGLSLIVLMYLFFQQRLALFKELVISLLYSAGILLPAMSLTSVTISYEIIILITFFTLTAFINLVLFSWYDWRHDLADKQVSIVTFAGRESAKIILTVSFVIQIVFFVTLILISTYIAEASILLSMNVVLFILFLFPEKFKREGYYRLIGDAIFFLPLSYIFIPSDYGI